jgi:hypothetical protein
VPYFYIPIPLLTACCSLCLLSYATLVLSHSTPASPSCLTSSWLLGSDAHPLRLACLAQFTCDALLSSRPAVPPPQSSLPYQSCKPFGGFIPPMSLPSSQHMITGSIQTCKSSTFCLPVLHSLLASPSPFACPSGSLASPWSSRLLVPTLPDPLASPPLTHLSNFCHTCHSPSPPHSHLISPCLSHSPLTSSVGWSRVMCRWHVRLDMSWFRAVASLLKLAVLSSDSEPLLAESFSELTGFRDDVRGFCCDGTGEYPGQTR